MERRRNDRAGDSDGGIDSANLFYFIVFCVALVALLAAHLVPKDWPITASILKELGTAGIVSLVIIFTIERFTRTKTQKAADRLLERINADLFYAIYKRYIPNDVFVEVERALLHASVFRTDHEIYYTIENIDEPLDRVDISQYVRCRAQSRSRLKNVTGGPILHNVVLTLERPLDDALVKHCRIVSVKVGDVFLASAEVEKHTTATDTQIVFRYPVQIDAGKVLDVATDSLLLKGRTDQEIWASRVPSSGTSLTVSIPGRDLKVMANALHSEQLQPVLNTDVTKKWELKHGMFPYQSVVFWWKPVDRR